MPASVAFNARNDAFQRGCGLGSLLNRVVQSEQFYSFEKTYSGEGCLASVALKLREHAIRYTVFHERPSARTRTRTLGPETGSAKGPAGRFPDRSPRNRSRAARRNGVVTRVFDEWANDSGPAGFPWGSGRPVLFIREDAPGGHDCRSARTAGERTRSPNAANDSSQYGRLHQVKLPVERRPLFPRQSQQVRKAPPTE